MRTMTYQEWLALCKSAPDAANARCARAMGWKLGRDGMHWYCGKDVKNDICNWLPITDRNHAAMMVEEVKRRGTDAQIVFHECLNEAAERAEWDEWNPELSALLIPPDLLSYAAWSALTRKEEA